jgi:peptidoglycan hydrolase-like protein with peptidoglycan-binding domain
VVVDNVPPSIPTNLSATAVSATEIDLSWASSTDNIGVAGYDIYQNGINIATTTTLSYANTGLSPSTSYTYTIDTFDGAGNASAQSSSTSATTQAQSSGGGGGGGTVSGGGGGGGTYIPASTSTTATSPLTGASSTSLGASDSMTELLSLIAEVRSLSLQLFLRGNNGSVLTVGSTGQDVWALQIYLINNNLLAPTGPAGSKLTTPTSYFGTLTKNALAEYQAQVGISPTSGILGAKTYGYLETVAGGKPSTSIVAPAAPVVTTVTKTTPAPVAATPSISSAVQTLSLGSTGSGVVTLQKILVKNGYLQAGIFANGTFDASTLRAVETFQCLENIVCSGLGYGVVGPRTRTALGM